MSLRKLRHETDAGGYPCDTWSISGTGVQCTRYSSPQQQYFSIGAPVRAGYEEALPLFRDIASRDAPQGAAPLSAPGFNPRYERRYPLDTEYAAFAPELQQPGLRQIALVLAEPHARYFVICRQEPTAHSLLNYVSGERTVPPYLAHVFHQFLPGVSEEAFAADFARFEEKLKPRERP